MIARRSGALASVALLLVAAASPGDLQRRLIPEEALALPVAAAGAGTSGLHAIATRFLKGDPAHPGLYTISITVPPNTKIAAHTHRDDRTATVVAGLWHFGYGPVAKEDATRSLAPANGSRACNRAMAAGRRSTPTTTTITSTRSRSPTTARCSTRPPPT